VRLIEIAVLLGSGVVAGVLFGVALSVVPMFLRLSPSQYVDTHRLIGRNFDPTLPLTVLGTTALDVVLAVLAHGTAARVRFAAAAALLFAVSAVSHLANVPINRSVKTLPPGPVPADWDDPRRRWRNWNLLRTSCALAALLINAVAVVAARP
jgi:uncharacterized membrane protein